MVFQEASKGFASMADELAKNKKFNKSRQSIDAGDDSLALQVEKSLRKKKFGGENSDFVAPKLKPVEKQDNKTTGQSGEKRKSFVPLPSGKSFEKDETENKGAEEEPVTQKPGLISNCIYSILSNCIHCHRTDFQLYTSSLYRGLYSISPAVSKPPELPSKTKKPSTVSEILHLNI